MTLRCRYQAVLLLAACGLAIGCGDDGAPANSRSRPPAGTASQSSPGGGTKNPPSAKVASALPSAIRSGKVELRVGEGEELYSFKPKGSDSAKFYDKAGKEICKLTFRNGKLQVKQPDDQPLFELKPKDDKVMIKDATGENELFKFKLKGDNIDFYAPGDQRLYRIRKKDYGYALEDNSDKTLFRAKTREGRIVLRNLDDVTVMYSNDLQNPLGLLFFRMKELSLEQQAACLLFFLE